MTAALAVVGALNRDAVLDVPRLPQPGDTAVGLRPATTGFGGKGANQAAAAAAFLGTPDTVAMVGCVGDDAAGQDMLDDLRERGVDVDAIRRTAGASGSATIAVDPAGENLIVVDPGANASLTPDDVRVPLVADAAVLLLQLEVPADVVLAAISHTRGRVVLNPAPASAANRFTRGVDVLVPNRLELAELAGAPPADHVREALAQAESLSPRTDVVVTMGHQGALVVQADGKTAMVEAPEVRAVDSTGAGDCFCGVLACLLVEGVDLVAATRIAVAAASMSVDAKGARGHLPNRADVRWP